MSRADLRHAAVALSLANLLFLKGWVELLEGAKHPYFRREMAYYWFDVGGLLFDLLLLAALFWAADWLARRSERPALLGLARAGFVATGAYLLFLVLNVIRRQYPAFSLRTLAASTGKPVAIALGLALLAGLAYLFWRFRPPVARSLASLLLMLTPVLALTVGKALWTGWLSRDLAAADIPLSLTADEAGDEARPRVLWFVFDKWDYRLTFPDRPPGVELPELDRLAAAGFNATQARSPAPVTSRSVPAASTGKLVTRAIPVAADRLQISFEDAAAPVLWTSQPSLFSRTDGDGFRTGILGWYHPYCRLFREELAACEWMAFREAPSRFPLLKSMAEFAVQALPPWARIDALRRLETGRSTWDSAYQITTYRTQLGRALQFASSPGLDLVLVHWSVPHEPFILDPETGELSERTNLDEGYFGNLRLVDGALRQVRESLQQSGLAARTIRVITTDHAWGDSSGWDGKRDERIPFLVEFPGASPGVTYDQPFNTVLTYDLILALLRGEIASPQELAGWLDRRR